MSISTPPLPQRYLRTPEAARLLGLSERTLEKHRVMGTGPAFLKLGGRVVYSVDSITNWAAQGERTSTKSPGNGYIFPTTRRRLPPPSTPSA